MRVYIHFVASCKTNQGDAVILGIGNGHTGWCRTADDNGYAISDNLGHYLAGDSAA